MMKVDQAPIVPPFPASSRIVVRNPDGTVGIIVPAPGAPRTSVMAAIPPGASYSIVHMADIPEDRTFREAWKHDLSVDMPKARDIHRDRLRRERAPLLAALDVAQLRGQGDEKKKQALRDITADPRIEAAETPEELLAIGLPR